MQTPYERSSKYSECKLGKIRDHLRELSLGDTVILACGSYARREASAQSDIDYFMVSDGAGKDPAIIESVRSEVEKIVPNDPSKDGAFAVKVKREEILDNIGGDDDSNQNITRRILFLLEGEWLFNEQGLQKLRREILERYIRKGMTDHQLALFLLNDIIRYYRTVAVDYEFKISKEQQSETMGNQKHQTGFLAETSLCKRFVQHRDDRGSCTGRKDRDTGGFVWTPCDETNDSHMRQGENGTGSGEL